MLVNVKKMYVLVIVFGLFIPSVLFGSYTITYNCRTVSAGTDYFDDAGNNVGPDGDWTSSVSKTKTICDTATLPGDRPDELPNPDDLDDVEDAAGLEEWIRENADALGGDADDLADRVKQGEIEITQENGEVTDVTWTPCVGDPVRIATGEFVLESSDFSMLNDIPFEISRNYLSTNRSAHSMGQGWSFNYDTRIISGVKDNAEDEYEGLTEIKKEYDTLVAQEIVFEDFETKLAQARTILIRARQTESELSGYAGYSEIASMYAQAVEKLEKWENYVALLEQYKADYEAIRETGAGINEKVEQSEREYRHAFANNQRNRYIVNGTDPEYLTKTGNNTLNYVDETGKHILYSINSAPDYTSQSVYPDGSINYYPAGSTATATDPGAPGIYIEADGSFLLTKKDRSVYHYSFYGQLEKIVDRNGNNLRFTYDDGHYLAEITDDYNRSVTLTREDGGRISTITDPKGRVFSYDYRGNMLSGITDAQGNRTGYEYSNNVLSRVVKADGSSRKYYYENFENKYAAKVTEDEEGNREYFDYNFADNYTIYRTDAGVWEKHYFNEKYLVYKIEYQDGSYVFREYDDNNNIIRRKDELGRESRFEYDENNNLTKKIFPDGYTSEFTYNSFNKVESFTDRAGRITDYTYDEKGNLLSVIYPDNSTTSYVYNSKGRPVKITDRNGISTYYRYDEYGNTASVRDDENNVNLITNDILGNIVTVTDPAGYQTSYEYDNNNKVIKVTDSKGNSEHYTYNSRKDMTGHTDKKGNVTAIEYDKLHNITKITNALGEVTEFTFRMDGKMLSKKTGDTNTTAYEYNSRGKLISRTLEETGVTVRFEYDAAGQLLGEADGNGNWTAYTYDELGQVVEILNPAGGLKILTYNKTGKIIGVTDEAGHSSNITFDIVDRPVKTVNAEGIINEFSYDKEGNLLKITDGNGQVTSYLYNNNYKRVGLIDQAGNQVIRSFNSRGLITSVTDKRGFSTHTEYDGLGQVVKVTNPDLSTEHYDYDVNGNIVRYTDELGNSENLKYDALNRLIKKTDAQGNSRFIAYNYLGEISSVTDAEGYTNRFYYDGDRRLIKSINPLGYEKNYTYDNAGNMTAYTDEEGFVTNYDYDLLSRQVKKTGPDGVILAYTYDAVGNIIGVTGGNGETYSYEYDAVGRVTGEVNREGAEQTFSYDNNNNLITKIDFNGNETRNYYDVLNKLVKTEFADRTVKFFSYDPAGNLIGAENSEALNSFTYDSRNRVIEEAAYYKTNNLTTVIRNSFDKKGNKTARTIIEGGKELTTRYSYDKVYNLTGVTGSGGETTTMVYDKVGRQVIKNLPGSTGTDYTYDALGNIKTIVNWEQKIIENKGKDNSKGKGKKKGHSKQTSSTVEKEILQSFGYIYDKRNKLTYRVEGSRDVTAYNYDNSGRLSEVYYPFGGKKKEAFEKELEDAGLQAAKIKEGVTLFIPASTEAELESLYGEIKEKEGYALNSGEQTYFTEHFSYDDDSNILAITTPMGTINHEYDKENRLLRKGNRTYTHDNNGNLTLEKINDHQVTYSYNPENRLVDIYGKGDWKYKQDKVKGEKWGSVYSYDAFGRQIEKIEYHLTKEETEAHEHDVTFLFYQGMNPVYSYNGKFKYDTYAPGVDKDHLETLEYKYVNGKILSTLHRDKKGKYKEEKSNFYYTDNKGSVTYVTKAKGGAHEALEYDAWGFVYKGKLDKTDFIGYTGKVFDSQSQTYNYGFRDYSPARKQWLTTDPIRDGINWKAYLGGDADPIGFIDMWGLETTLLVEQGDGVTVKRYKNTQTGRVERKVVMYDNGKVIDTKNPYQRDAESKTYFIAPRDDEEEEDGEGGGGGGGGEEILPDGAYSRPGITLPENMDDMELGESIEVPVGDGETVLVIRDGNKFIYDINQFRIRRDKNDGHYDLNINTADQRIIMLSPTIIENDDGTLTIITPEAVLGGINLNPRPAPDNPFAEGDEDLYVDICGDD